MKTLNQVKTFFAASIAVTSLAACGSSKSNGALSTTRGTASALSDKPQAVTTVSGECFDAIRLAPVGNQKTKSTEDQKYLDTALAKAKLDYSGESGDDPVYTEIHFKSTPAANWRIVSIDLCDDKTGFEQGNCLSYYFQPVDGKLAAVVDTPHSGASTTAKIVCEK